MFIAWLAAPGCGSSNSQRNMGDAGSGGAGGGAGGWDGHIIQEIGVALGPYALGVSTPTQVVFRPEVGTADDDDWHGSLAGSYDLMLTEGGATGTGRYRLARTDDALTFDISVDQTTTGGSMATTSSPSWFHVFVQKPGATGFRMNVTAANASFTATGQGTAGLSVTWHDGDGAAAKILYVAAATPDQSIPLMSPQGTSIDLPTDDTGLADFDQVGLSLIADVKGAGDAAHSEARVTFQFVPQP